VPDPRPVNKVALALRGGKSRSGTAPDLVLDSLTLIPLTRFFANFRRERKPIPMDQALASGEMDSGCECCGGDVAAIDEIAR